MGPKRRARIQDSEKKNIRNVEEKEIQDLEEAIEDKFQIEDEEQEIESEGEGDDLMKDMEKDYKPIKELDVYDPNDLDDEEYSQMPEEERKKVEHLLKERDRNKFQKGSRIPLALLEEMEEYSEGEEVKRKLRRQKMRFTSGVEEDTEYKDTTEYLNRTDVKGKLSDWLKEPHVVKYIQISFQKFIKNYKDENGTNIYENRIIDMCTANNQSLDVNYSHINSSNAHLAIWIAQLPAQTLPILNDVAFSLTCEIFPQYSNIYNEIFVRIQNLPILDKLRDLRHYHLNTLIRVRGVLTKRTNVFSQLKKVMFYCGKCGEKIGPFMNNGSEDIKIGSCQSCQSAGPFHINNEETVYRNYQKVTVQESPGTVPPGRIPRQKEVILTNDLVDSVKPGDEVEVTGIYISKFDYSMNVKYAFPVFQTLIEAVHVKRLNDIEIGELRDEDKISSHS
jgi:DNA replication licensing factor MCM2